MVLKDFSELNHNGEEACAKRNQHVRAQSCRLVSKFAFYANHGA
jgi:hypothetical protein